ncbi:MAG TPA: 23S rRNA (guanosine(2251)-2'-O)-methyltransferase RlmB, partial [Pilimelia sp.]|nr:23S rRNA (guanosine(2251)-2'-O)-methyltransferase RlmB [Pilimelia sp.]
MAGNSQRRGRRATPKKGAAAGSGGKNRASLQGKGRTLPADERPWHKAYSGTEEVPQRTAWKQEKEKRA